MMAYYCASKHKLACKTASDFAIKESANLPYIFFFNKAIMVKHQQKEWHIIHIIQT